MSLKKGRSMEMMVVMITKAVRHNNRKRLRLYDLEETGSLILISLERNSLPGHAWLAHFSMKAKRGWQ